MNRSDVLHNRQFAQQEVLRTITLGLAPFIPFQQQYALEIKANRENFEMLPTPDDPDALRGSPSSWGDRKQAYLKQPGQSPAEIMSNAPEAKSRETAEKLKLLFANMGKTPTANKFEESVVGEMLSTLGEQQIAMKLDELGTSLQKGIDSSELMRNPTGGQGFDRQMTDELRTVLSKAMGGKDMSNVVAVEETEAKVSKEIQKGLKGLEPKEAIAQFQKNVEKVYGDFNALLSTFEIGDDGLAGTLGRAYADPFFTTDAYNKQLVARAIDLVKSGMGGKEYMYTVPIGNTGIAGNVFINTISTGKYPQLKYSTHFVQTTGHGRLIEMMGKGLGEISTSAGKQFIKDIAAMDMEAMNESVLTADRVSYIGKMQEVGLDAVMSAGADITMTKKKDATTGVMGLGTKEMADSLNGQIKAVLSDPATKNDFTTAFKQMIADANRVSDDWKNAVRPPEEFQGAEGVWKGDSGVNWSAETAKGQDFSISPFLFMRRAGVKSFESKNKSSFL